MDNNLDPLGIEGVAGGAARDVFALSGKKKYIFQEINTFSENFHLHRHNEPPQVVKGDRDSRINELAKIIRRSRPRMSESFSRMPF